MSQNSLFLSSKFDFWLFSSKFSSFLYKNCQNFGFNMKMSQNSGFYRQNLIFGCLAQNFLVFCIKIVKILVLT